MLVDPNAEIVKQLARIADTLNKPGPSPWIEWSKYMASFAIGLVSAYATMLLQGRTNDRREENKMRRLVYCELAESFLALHTIVEAAALYKDPRKVEFSVLQDQFSFDGESYMKQNRAIFYQLPEGAILTALYARFHNIRTGETYPALSLKSDLGFFSDEFKKRPSLQKYFKKFVDASSFSIIEKAVLLYKWEMSIEDMIAAGMIRVVDSESEPPTTAG